MVIQYIYMSHNPAVGAFVRKGTKNYVILLVYKT